MEFWLLNILKKYILSQKLNKSLIVLDDTPLHKGEDILNIFKKQILYINIYLEECLIFTDFGSFL